jgi:hypothetical protein
LVVGNKEILTVVGTLNTDITAATYNLVVSAFDTPIIEETADLCSKVACPVKAGPINIKFLKEIPPETPALPGDFKLSAVDPSGKELLCYTFHAEIKEAPAAAAATSSSF